MSVYRVESTDNLSLVLNASNTYFIIEDDFDIASGDVTIGSNSTLEFHGGCIRAQETGDFSDLTIEDCSLESVTT